MGRPAGAVLGVVLGLLAMPVQAAERRAGDAIELQAALAAARPGDTVVMRNGVWKDLDLVLRSPGTDAAPVRLRAESPGGVVLTGSSRLTFQAPHLIVSGLLFRDGALAGGAVVVFASHHGRLTESAIVDYNPADPLVEYHWVILEGSDNRVDHCQFRGKNNRRPVIANRPGARRNRVDNSHFKDIAFRSQNGREVIQIMGYGMSEELGQDGAFCTVERNLFEQAHGEGAEIISIKSNRNVIRDNTFRQTKGGVTNRSGNFNLIEGNFILGENEPRSYGIRVTGQHHRVLNNYVANVAGAGLLLVTGEYIDQPLTERWSPIAREGTPLGRVPRYAQVKHGVFAHNSFVNCGGTGIEVGSSYKAGWPRGQQVLLPESNLIVNNLVRQAGQAVAVRATAPEGARPFDRFVFQTNTFQGNLVFGGPLAGVAPASFLVGDPLLVDRRGLLRPGRGSPAVNGGRGDVTSTDIDGQPRRGKPDIGADEVSSAAVRRRPLLPDDVGPGWTRGRAVARRLP